MVEVDSALKNIVDSLDEQPTRKWEARCMFLCRTEKATGAFTIKRILDCVRYFSSISKVNPICLQSTSQ